MTPDKAYATLAELLGSSRGSFTGATAADLRTAWNALNEALSGSGDLPYPWARLNALASAHRAGMPDTATWTTYVRKGYAPPADGQDSAGRAWWHPATVDSYVNGGWRKAPRQRDPDEAPPLSGNGAGRDEWADFAARRGITITTRMGRDAIQEACREIGIID